MSFDNAYEALADAQDDARWAFGGQPDEPGASPGTGREDPLSGMDTSVPSGVDGDDLATYCLMLGDDALVASHRLQQWCTNLPELEEEVAVANIALDLLGQARMLLTRAGKADGTGRTEDSYAYFRDERRFRNVRLVESEQGDFAQLIAMLLVFVTWRLAVVRRLESSNDPVLAAIAGKAVNELRYHREYAADWAVRLGDGTEYSRTRMRDAFEAVWPLVEELFETHPHERTLAAAGVAADPAEARAEFDEALDQVFTAAGLARPKLAARAGVAGRTGRDGLHTEAMGYVLTELQSLARAHPEATW